MIGTRGLYVYEQTKLQISLIVFVSGNRQNRVPECERKICNTLFHYRTFNPRYVSVRLQFVMAFEMFKQYDVGASIPDEKWASWLVPFLLQSILYILPGTFLRHAFMEGLLFVVFSLIRLPIQNKTLMVN